MPRTAREVEAARLAAKKRQEEEEEARKAREVEAARLAATKNKSTRMSIDSEKENNKKNMVSAVLVKSSNHDPVSVRDSANSIHGDTESASVMMTDVTCDQRPKAEGGYKQPRRLSTARATQRAKRHKPLPNTVQKIDANGLVKFRTDRIHRSSTSGEGCCFDAVSFATGQSFTRMMFGQSKGQISITRVAAWADKQGKKYQFRFRKHNQSSFAKMIAKTEGIFVARNAIIDAKGRPSNYHYVAFDAWRGIWMVGKDDHEVWLEKTDYEDPQRFQKNLCAEHGMCPHLHFVYLVKVSWKRRHLTHYK